MWILFTNYMHHLLIISEQGALWAVAGVVLVYCILYILHYKGRHTRYIKKAKKVFNRINEKNLSEGQVLAYLRKIDPYVFEELIILGFAAKGYGFKRNKRYSGDGGVDGRVFLNGKKYLLQCKRYSKHINPRHVEAFSNVCREERCEGFFVHTGKTGKRSRDNVFIAGNVSIISGNRLAHLLMKDYANANV